MSEYTGAPRKRTYTQNRALHLYFTQLAKELNEHGLTVQKVLAEAVELNWTPHSIKELIWKPIQDSLLGKKSTTELDKINDIDEIWEHINRHIGIKWGLYIPFPHKDPNDIAPII